MMRSEEAPEQAGNPAADRRLWQRCRMIDAREDEAARFLDLAAFADGLLDAEEQDRVEALLAADPEAAGDVRAARAFAAAEPTAAGLERIVARASAMSPDADPATGRVIPLAPRRGRRAFPAFAQWGSLAAAIALAGWLGFAMGSDTSRAFNEPRQPSDTTFLPELFDPAPNFLRDLGEGVRT
jgi:anti-sigma factor RsiW